MEYLEAKLIGGLLLVLALVGAGAWIERTVANAEIAKIKASYNASYNAAVNAKDAANKRANDLETKMAENVTQAVTTFIRSHNEQDDKNKAVIADLRNGAQRLRVSTNHSPACSSPLPGPAAGATRGPDPAPETLAGPVAARLAGRYADYNSIVDELTLCQAVIRADRLTAP